jgi:hypothetical protein
LLKVIGKVYLDGNRFTTDPHIERSWPTRQSVLPGLEGSVTVQDFGRFAKDMRLKLSSAGNFMNASLKAIIDGLAATRGATYSYTDYQGIEATVKILSFEAQPTFIRDGDFILYEYALELKVMSLSKLDGVSYAGL